MNAVQGIMIGITKSIISAGVNAQELVAVEWAPFVKLPEISDENIIEAADNVNVESLSRQSGFIKRELVKKSETEYADIIHWSTKADAISAGNKVEECAVCSEYFKLMDMEKSANAGAGFSHYDPQDLVRFGCELTKSARGGCRKTHFFSV